MEMTSASAGSSMRACVHVLVMDSRRYFPHVTRFSAAKKAPRLFSAVLRCVWLGRLPRRVRIDATRMRSLCT
jgi:hypothetical protein